MWFSNFVVFHQYQFFTPIFQLRNFLTDINFFISLFLSPTPIFYNYIAGRKSFIHPQKIPLSWIFFRDFGTLFRKLSGRSAGIFMCAQKLKTKKFEIIFFSSSKKILLEFLSSRKHFILWVIMLHATSSSEYTSAPREHSKREPLLLFKYKWGLDSQHQCATQMMLEDLPIATHNHHKVTIPSRFLKKRKLFHDVVCILRYYSIFIRLST